MTVRLVADIQNRLFWRVCTGRASECCIPSAGSSQASRDGQRCAGWAAPAGLWASALLRTGWSWSRRLPPSQQKEQISGSNQRRVSRRFYRPATITSWSAETPTGIPIWARIGQDQALRASQTPLAAPPHCDL